MSKAKEFIQNIIEQMPDDSTYEEIYEKIINEVKPELENEKVSKLRELMVSMKPEIILGAMEGDMFEKLLDVWFEQKLTEELKRDPELEKAWERLRRG